MVSLRFLGNNIFDILLFLQLLCFPLGFILSSLVTLSIKTSTDCQKFLEEPILILIFLTVIVILAGGLGFHHQSTWLLWVFFILMPVLIGFHFQFSISLLKFTKNGNDVGEALKNWNKVEMCLQDNKVCDTSDKDDLTVFQYYLKRTPFVKYGCCNPTQCFDCETCKAGYLATLKKDWNTFALIGIISLVFLTVIYSIGCIYLFMYRSRKTNNDDQ